MPRRSRSTVPTPAPTPEDNRVRCRMAQLGCRARQFHLAVLEAGDGARHLAVVRRPPSLKPHQSAILLLTDRLPFSSADVVKGQVRPLDHQLLARNLPSPATVLRLVDAAGPLLPA